MAMHRSKPIAHQQANKGNRQNQRLICDTDSSEGADNNDNDDQYDCASIGQQLSGKLKLLSNTVFHGLYQEDDVSRILIKEMDTTGNKLCDFGLEYLSQQERDSEYSKNNVDELRGRMIKW